MNVILRDFQPSSRWEQDVRGEKWKDGTPLHLIDKETGRLYWNESKSVVRIKCFLLTIASPLGHSITAVVNVAERTLRLLSLFHFWRIRDANGAFNFKTSLSAATRDALRIIATPLSLVGLELAAIYGLLKPYDGRKLYASIERAMYGTYILAPCFQPSPTSHAFGGDPGKKNAF